MDRALSHHGVLGQRWGVRRTPQQLGHDVSPKSRTKKEKERISDIPSTDLQARIARLQLENNYKNLVKQKRDMDMSFPKKLFMDAVKQLEQQTLSAIVSKLVNKITKSNDKEPFDINNFRNIDLDKLDPDTLANVSKWYESAAKITRNRDALDKAKASSESKASSTTDKKKK